MMRKRDTIGVICGCIHLVAIALIVQLILKGDERDWPMYWMIFFVADFPVSLFFIPLGILLPVFSLNAPSPFNNVLNFWLPFFVFGILGTVWYFFLPRIVIRIFKPRDR